MATKKKDDAAAVLEVARRSDGVLLIAEPHDMEDGKAAVDEAIPFGCGHRQEERTGCAVGWNRRYAANHDGIDWKN